MNQQTQNQDYAPALAGQSNRGSGDGGMVAVAESRAAQETQAAMVVAKRFPRDQNAAYERIMRSCHRKTLAENAVYAYPRGGQTVSGPSIRLAEVLAQNWGNVDFGIIELEQRAGESVVMAYAWDLETNTRQTKVFTVKHERHTRNGSYALTDPRDIYEMTANQGARRLRACILGIIPGDIVDAAVGECERTLQGQTDEPLQDRVRKMVAAFGAMGVTSEMVARRLGHNLDATSEAELANLRKIYRSLRDGMSSVEQWFQREPAPAAGEESQETEKAGATGDDLSQPRQAGRAEPAADPKPDGTECFRDLRRSLRHRTRRDSILQMKQEASAKRNEMTEEEYDQLSAEIAEKLQV